MQEETGYYLLDRCSFPDTMSSSKEYTEPCVRGRGEGERERMERGRERGREEKRKREKEEEGEGGGAGERIISYCVVLSIQWSVTLLSPTHSVEPDESNARQRAAPAVLLLPPFTAFPVDTLNTFTCALLLPSWREMLRRGQTSNCVEQSLCSKANNKRVVIETRIQRECYYCGGESDSRVCVRCCHLISLANKHPRRSPTIDRCRLKKLRR